LCFPSDRPAAFDEHPRGAIQDLLAAILMGDAGTEADFLASLLRVTYAVAEHGSAVIVGRGAEFVLDPGRVLRVRVVGPIDSRSRELAVARELSEREARGEVQRIDRERQSFVRQQTRVVAFHLESEGVLSRPRRLSASMT
jgi:hypothetical protein